MKPERRLPGCLGALLFALPAAPAAWLFTRSDVFAGLAGLAGFLLSQAGWRLFAGRSSGLGTAVSALLAPLAALPGLYLGYAELILRENERYGCTWAEARALVPAVVSDPGNRVQVLWDLIGIVALDLLGAWLLTKYRAMTKDR